jgi:hypothetical protein
LQGVSAILTDIWSISSIALNVARLCEVYFGGARRMVEVLPTYNDGSPEAQQRTRAVVERLDADCRATKADGEIMLCLLSATHTGSLATHLTTIFETSSLSLQPRSVALFALGETTIPSLYDLKEDPRFRPFERPTETTNDAVTIDPQVYFPLRFEDTIIEINKQTADQSRSFFDRYIGTRLIETHRSHNDGAGRVRHHAIHLATERLLQVPAFVEGLKRKLGELPTLPKLVVSPTHPAGRALAELARGHFEQAGHSCQVFAHDTLYLRSEDVKLRELLRSAGPADALLVIDDVFITGARLAQYQRHTRYHGYKGRVDYLVGVARPDDHQVWANAQRILTYRAGVQPRHSLNCVDMVILPNWREPDCPWCVEQELYSRLSRGGPLPERLALRREALQEGLTAGLTNNLFLQIPGIAPLALGPGSFFTAQSANQSEIFAAVASALQYLRTQIIGDRPRLGPRHFPISTVLKHEDYLCSKWTDSVLRATFLRAATADELTYAAPEKEEARMQQLMELVVQEGEAEHDIVLEVLLAAALGKCRVQSAQLRDRLNAFGVGEVGAYLLDRIDSEHR